MTDIEKLMIANMPTKQKHAINLPFQKSTCKDTFSSLSSSLATGSAKKKTTF